MRGPIFMRYKAFEPGAWRGFMRGRTVVVRQEGERFTARIFGAGSRAICIRGCHSRDEAFDEAIRHVLQSTAKQRR